MTNRTAAELDALALPDAPALGRPLTSRQRAVLRLIAEGRTSAEAGTELYLAESSVKSLLGRAMRKLGAPTRAAAVHRAWQLGILS